MNLDHIVVTDQTAEEDMIVVIVGDPTPLKDLKDISDRGIDQITDHVTTEDQDQIIHGNVE